MKKYSNMISLEKKTVNCWTTLALSCVRIQESSPLVWCRKCNISDTFNRPRRVKEEQTDFLSVCNVQSKCLSILSNLSNNLISYEPYSYTPFAKMNDRSQQSYQNERTNLLLHEPTKEKEEVIRQKASVDVGWAVQRHFIVPPVFGGKPKMYTSASGSEKSHRVVVSSCEGQNCSGDGTDRWPFGHVRLSDCDEPQ